MIRKKSPADRAKRVRGGVTMSQKHQFRHFSSAPHEFTLGTLSGVLREPMLPEQLPMVEPSFNSARLAGVRPDQSPHLSYQIFIISFIEEIFEMTIRQNGASTAKPK